MYEGGVYEGGEKEVYIPAGGDSAKHITILSATGISNLCPG